VVLVYSRINSKAKKKIDPAVSAHAPGQPKPYYTRFRRGTGKRVRLGSFATAEEAALCIARYDHPA
jgi:hypothetical protein